MSLAQPPRHSLGLTAGEIAAVAGGRVISGNPATRFTSLAIDSRQVPAGSLFVALPGARVDGHDFIGQALAAGAAGVVTARGELPPAARGDLPLAARDLGTAIPVAAGEPAAVTVVAVDDTLVALQAAAREWRSRLRATVIGIAGSNGKTTTKEVVASVLRQRGRTFATPGNENSQVGAPMAILAAPLDTELLVLELGTSAPGELGRLASLARPDMAIVTAAFAEHLEFLGSVEGVIAAETEILDHLRPGVLALVGSAEPDLVAAARRRVGLRVETLGCRAADAWRLSAVQLSRDGTRFVLRDRAWHVPLLGEPAAWAASFAIAVGRELGLPDGKIQRGLEGATPAAHRMAAVKHASRPIFVLDDCYNSNPASARAAIEAAVALAAPGDRLILVLGDMLELGATTRAAHRELGQDVARLAPGALVVAVGNAARLTGETARDLGVVVELIADAEQASRLLIGLLRDGRPATILVKASRGIGLETVVSAATA